MLSRCALRKFALGHGLEISLTSSSNGTLFKPPTRNQKKRSSRRSDDNSSVENPKFCTTTTSTPEQLETSLAPPSAKSASFYGLSQETKSLLLSSDHSNNPPAEFIPVHLSPFLKQVRLKLERLDALNKNDKNRLAGLNNINNDRLDLNSNENERKKSKSKNAVHDILPIGELTSRRTNEFSLEDVDETLKILVKTVHYLNKCLNDSEVPSSSPLTTSSQTSNNNNNNNNSKVKDYLRYILFRPVDDSVSYEHTLRKRPTRNNNNDDDNNGNDDDDRRKHNEITIFSEDDKKTAQKKSYKNLLVLLEKRVAFDLSETKARESEVGGYNSNINHLLASALFNLHQLSKMSQGLYQIFDVSLINLLKNWRCQHKFSSKKSQQQYHRQQQSRHKDTSSSAISVPAMVFDESRIPSLSPSQMSTSDVAKTLVVLGEHKISKDKSRLPVAFAQEMLKLLARRIGDQEQEEILANNNNNNNANNFTNNNNNNSNYNDRATTIKLKPAAAASIIEAAAYYELSGGEAEILCEKLLFAEGIASIEVEKVCSLFKSLCTWKDAPANVSSTLMEALAFRIAVSVPTTPDDEEELISCFEALLCNDGHPNWPRLVSTMVDAVEPLLRNKIRRLNQYFGHVVVENDNNNSNNNNDSVTRTGDMKAATFWAKQYLPIADIVAAETNIRTSDALVPITETTPTTAISLVDKEALLARVHFRFSVAHIIVKLNARAREGLWTPDLSLDLKRSLFDLHVKDMRIRTKRNEIWYEKALSNAIEFLYSNPELLENDPLMLKFLNGNVDNKNSSNIHSSNSDGAMVDDSSSGVVVAPSSASSSASSSTTISPLILASPLKVVKAALTNVSHLQPTGFSYLIQVLSKLENSLVQEIFNEVSNVKSSTNNNNNNNDHLLSTIVNRFTSLAPNLPLHAYSSTLLALFSFNDSAVLRDRNLVDVLTMSHITGKLEAADTVVNKLSTPNVIAIAKAWALIEQSGNDAVRPSPIAVQNLYNHVTNKLATSPTAVSISEIPEVFNAMKAINSLTPRLYSNLAKRFHNIVVGGFDFDSPSLLKTLSDSSSSTSSSQHLFASRENSELYALFDAFGTLGEEFIVAGYRGAGSFKRSWSAIRGFVIESAFKFDVVSLVKCANAFAVLNSGDSSVFGVLAARLSALLSMARANDDGESTAGSTSNDLRAFLANKTLSPSASAALLLQLVLSHRATTSSTPSRNAEIQEKLEPIASVLLFNISRSLSSCEISPDFSQEDVWYPNDSITALDALVRFYSLVFDGHEGAGNSGGRDGQSAVAIPPVVFDMWHTAFESVRRSFRDEVILSSDDAPSRPLPSSDDLSEAKPEALRARSASLDPDFEMAIRKIEPRLILSAATGLAASSLSDSLIEDAMIQILIVSVLQNSMPSSSTSSSSDSSFNNGDLLVDALACVVRLSQKQLQLNGENDDDVPSFVKAVENVAPFAVRLNEASRTIIKPSSVALAAHSLASVNQNTRRGQNDASADDDLGVGLLEWKTLNHLGKAAMRLFPERI